MLPLNAVVPVFFLAHMKNSIFYANEFLFEMVFKCIIFPSEMEICLFSFHIVENSKEIFSIQVLFECWNLAPKLIFKSIFMYISKLILPCIGCKWINSKGKSSKRCCFKDSMALSDRKMMKKKNSFSLTFFSDVFLEFSDIFVQNQSINNDRS